MPDPPLPDVDPSLVDLLRRLVAIDSVNPDLVPGGAGEHEIARLIASWLEDRGLEVQMTTTASGRPNVVGRCGLPALGRSLLFLGHTDTVGAGGMSAPFDPRIENGRLHGRGAYDMKAGLAAAMSGAARLADRPDIGQVIIAAVCDEEAGGSGTRALLEQGGQPDAAIVLEPTDLAVATAHKGYASFEIETRGKAAHGSRPDLGVDAIMMMGPVLIELGRLDREMQAGRRHPLLGPTSLHASLIEGGQEESSYPERALLKGECRTLPGDDPEPALRAAFARAGVDGELRMLQTGSPFEVSAEEEVVQILSRHTNAPQVGMPFWTDAALLAAAGIPAVIYGPAGGGAHAADEWVDVASVQRVRNVLVSTALEFCRAPELTQARPEPWPDR